MSRTPGGPCSLLQVREGFRPVWHVVADFRRGGSKDDRNRPGKVALSENLLQSCRAALDRFAEACDVAPFCVASDAHEPEGMAFAHGFISKEGAVRNVDGAQRVATCRLPPLLRVDQSPTGSVLKPS